MSKSKKITLTNSLVGKKLKCCVKILDSSYYGKNASFKFISKVSVKDSRPVNDEKVLYKKDFKIESIEENFEIDLLKYNNYTYKGSSINIDLITELVIDDAIFFDTKVTEKIQREIGVKPKVSNSAKKMIDPKDNFNLIENLKAIPNDAKMFVIIFSFVGTVVIGLNTFLGFHDQFVLESQTYFYSHYNSDGESSSPLFSSLAGSGAVGAGIWFMIKTQLRRYMKFFFKKKKFMGNIDKIYKVSDVVGGNSRINLKNVELKILACNMEKGQYTRGSGSNTRTVTFSNPIRAVSLYDKKIDFIPKNVDISEHLPGDFSLENMYKVLYPEQMISSSHGLKVHFEVQLIHNELIDQELIGESSFFKYKNFLQG